MFVAEEEELPRVMREIADALKGRGAALTLHPDDGYPERVIYADEAAGVSREVVERLLAAGKLRPDPSQVDLHRWITFDGDDGRRGEALSLPVQRVPGHGRLIITVFFDDLDEHRRAEAEAVYLSRRPFAIGYFRLWQVDRANVRRMGATEAALNLMSLAAILLAASGKIIFTNDAARALLGEAEALRERDGRLIAAAAADTVRLQVAASHAIHGGHDPARPRRSPMLALARDGKPPLIVSVLPTDRPPEEPGDAAATVFVVDPALDIDALLTPVCKLFQMTNVETGLACLLASGSTLAEAAAALHLKEATARSYLKQIFLKTGANRQTELVRVLLSSLVRTTSRIPPEVI